MSDDDVDENKEVAFGGQASATASDLGDDSTRS